MSISLSTTLLLVDASSQASTIILPNPSTIAGKILYIRDIAGTINARSTVSLVTETTHVSIATLFLPSSFITLYAAPVSSIQYHVIGGNYLEQVGNTATTTTTFSTLSTAYFYGIGPTYSNSLANLSTMTTTQTIADLISSSIFVGSNIQFDPNFALTAVNGQLYFNNAPWRGKNYAIQTPAAPADDTFPYQFMSTGSTFPLYWFDGKDSNVMFTHLSNDTKPTQGQGVARWYAKPSTLQLFAYQGSLGSRGTYETGGVFFTSNGGYLFSNSDPNYADFPYALPLTPSYTMYFVATKRLEGGTGSYYFGRPGYPGGAPAILTNYTWTGLYSNGNLSTPVTSTSNSLMWYALSEFIPITMNQDNTCNLVVIKKSVLQPNPVLQVYFNGSNVYSAFSSSDPPDQGQPRQITVLGEDVEGAFRGPSAYYADFLTYNDTIHTPAQQQQMEGWLAAKWNIRSKLPKTHPYYQASN